VTPRRFTIEDKLDRDRNKVPRRAAERLAGIMGDKAAADSLGAALGGLKPELKLHFLLGYHARVTAAIRAISDPVFVQSHLGKSAGLQGVELSPKRGRAA
jgi:hypothetical protein